MLVLNLCVALNDIEHSHTHVHIYLTPNELFSYTTEAKCKATKIYRRRMNRQKPSFNHEMDMFECVLWGASHGQKRKGECQEMNGARRNQNFEIKTNTAKKNAISAHGYYILLHV